MKDLLALVHQIDRLSNEVIKLKILTLSLGVCIIVLCCVVIGMCGKMSVIAPDVYEESE